MKKEKYRATLNDWWDGLTYAQKKEVKTSHNSIDFSDLFQGEELYYRARRNLKEEIKRIDEELKILGVLLERNKLINWWINLTESEKKEVPIVHNSIDVSKIIVNTKVDVPQIRKFFKGEIREIDEELKQLKVLFVNDDKIIEGLMRDFISECNFNPDILWDIELSSQLSKRLNLKSLGFNNSDEYFEKFGFVPVSYLANKFNCKYTSCRTPRMNELRVELNQLLLKHKVSLSYNQVKGKTKTIGKCLNLRRIFCKWERSLTEDEKLALPFHGGKIKKIAFSHIIPMKHMEYISPILSFEIKRFSNEIMALKGVDYKTTKERNKIRYETSLNREKSKLSKFLSLRSEKISSINDFILGEEEYENVTRAFAAASLRATSKSGISTYLHGSHYYCELLKTKDISPKSELKECFNSWSLRDFKQFLGEKISESLISTSHANGILSSLRVTLNNLKMIRGFDLFYHAADGFETVKKSIAYKPYSPIERVKINEMLDKEIGKVRRKLKPYEKINRECADLNDVRVQARIIFEDDCDCKPIRYTGRDRTLLTNMIK